MTRQPGRQVRRALVKRSVSLDADQIDWIAARAAAEDLSESQVVRQAVRLAMSLEGAAVCPTCGQEWQR